MCIQWKNAITCEQFVNSTSISGKPVMGVAMIMNELEISPTIIKFESKLYNKLMLHKILLIHNFSLGKIQGQNKLYKQMSMYYGNGFQTKPSPCAQCTFPVLQRV